MTVYYCFIFCAILAGWLDISTNKTSAKNIIMVSFLGLLTIFIGFRYKSGLDWLFYSDLFNGDEFTLAIEPGYLIFSYLCSFIFNYWFYQFIVTLISVAFLVKFFRYYTENYTICVFIFFIYQFGFNTEAVRQVLSLSLALLAFRKYLDDRLTACILISIAAVFFHASALILFPFYILLMLKKLRFIKIACYFGIALSLINIYPIDFLLKAIGALAGNAYVEKLLWYGDSENANSIITFSLFFKLIIVGFIELRQKSIISKLSSNYSVRCISFIYLATYFMFLIDVYLGRYGTISTRLDVYFIPAFIISIILVIHEFKSGISKTIFYLFIMLYFTINFVRFTDNYYFQSLYVPYRNYVVDSIIGNKDIFREEDVLYYWKNKESLQ